MTDYIYLTRDQKRMVEQSVDLNALQIKMFKAGYNPDIDSELFHSMKKAYEQPELIRVKLGADDV
ncbi:hypothetical protein H7198_01760 [Fructobacillus sp. CRL 2054]|uniref:hypothetical protein n=1 Tax=Fructobacillus sp. CRL 2054 TaxID=2763007 RepID=UPI00237912CC|nr:hypothetical protein [Fructobacillus sp. CRL 2054]MDD9138339.1 hypothetical protein [Fructobacillus sp. CRL 2054]